MKIPKFIKKPAVIACCLVFCFPLNSAGSNYDAIPWEGIEAYMAGRGEEAVEIIVPVAEAGNGEAQHLLGTIYSDGTAMAPDYEKAAPWFRKAANSGSAEAAYNLGFLYENGMGVEKSEQAAFRWFLKGAKSGHPIAQFRMALRILPEIDAKDSSGRDWLVKSAENGLSDAQQLLGRLLLHGSSGFKKDESRSAIWFERAAEQGDPKAAELLGTMFAAGVGVPEDYVLAFKWLNLAKAKGVNTGDVLSALKQRMTQDQVAEGQRLSREFSSEPE